MKTIGAGQQWPTYLHYRPATAWGPAKVVFDRTTEDMATSISIPMESIRELIAGLSEMADQYEAEAQQEKAA